MRFIWSFRAIPELNHLDEQQRRDLISRCVNWRVRVSFAGESLFVGLFCSWVAMVLVAGWVSKPLMLVAGGLVMAAGSMLWFQFEFLRIRAALRLHLKQAFRGQRLPVCLNCGYNLTGTTSTRCSECGHTVIVPGPSGQRFDPTGSV